jgi:hypothetical protein
MQEAWDKSSRTTDGFYSSQTPASEYAISCYDEGCKLERELADAIRERDEARGQLAVIEDRVCIGLGSHPDSELWGEDGLIAATMRCVDALGEVTDQRDKAQKDSTYWMAIADAARKDKIFWMSIAEGRGRTDDEPVA